MARPIHPSGRDRFTRNWSLGAVVRKDDIGDDSIAVLLAADLPKIFLKTVKMRQKLRGVLFAPRP